MSSPVDQRLRDLNLNPEMAASIRGQVAQGQASQQAAQAGPSNVSYLTSRTSGTTYDIQGFSEAARARADLGFKTSGGPLQDAKNHGRYFLFKLNIGKGLIRVGPPNDAEYDRPRCQLCQNKPGGIACEHVFWLIDQVVRSRSHPPPQLMPDGSRVGGVPLYQLIQDVGLDKLLLRTQRRDQGLLEDTTEEGNPADVRKRIDQLSAILSTFEPSVPLPNELRAEASRIYKSFSDYIGQVAIQQPDIINNLESIIPPQLRAAVHFEKIRNQVNDAFYAFDNRSDFKASDCIATLGELLDQVVENYAERSADEFPDAAKYAVGALVTVLEGIIRRKDELYKLAIEKPRASLYFSTLEALSTKPAEVLSLYRDRVAHIAHEMEAAETSEPFLNLMSNIAGVAGVVGVTGAPESQKRKGPGGDGGSKKKGKSKK